MINQLVHLYSETHLGKRMPAYDGMKSLYTAGPLPFSSKEFVVKLVENDGRAAGPSTSKRYFPSFESYVARVLFSFSTSCCFINLIWVWFFFLSVAKRIESLRWLSHWPISQTFINYNSSCAASMLKRLKRQYKFLMLFLGLHHQKSNLYSLCICIFLFLFLS